MSLRLRASLGWGRRRGDWKAIPPPSVSDTSSTISTATTDHFLPQQIGAETHQRSTLMAMVNNVFPLPAPTHLLSVLLGGALPREHTGRGFLFSRKLRFPPPPRSGNPSARVTDDRPTDCDGWGSRSSSSSPSLHMCYGAQAPKVGEGKEGIQRGIEGPPRWA